MSYNGSGAWELPAGQPVVTGTTISSSTHNTLVSDLQQSLSNVICKDGQTTPVANIKFAGFRLLNIGNAIALTDAARASQVQNGAFNVLSSVAGATTITGAATPTPAAYAENQAFSFLAVAANGASPTLNVSSLGATPIFWNGEAATSNLWATGTRLDVAYVSTSSQTGFHVMGHSGFMPTNLLRVRGSLLSGNGSGGVQTSSPSADDQIFVSSASASAGGAWKSFITMLDATTSATATALSGDVNLNNTGTYFAGPGLAQPSAGEWLFMASITVTDTAGAATINARITDGTSVAASGSTRVAAANVPVTMFLAGFLQNPAGAVAIQVKDITSTSGVLLSNSSGESKDSTITAVRLGA